MSVIEPVITFIESYSGIDSSKMVYADHIDANALSYGIAPLPGQRVIEEDIIGRQLVEYPFSLEFTGNTASDITRVVNIVWTEDFADWLKAKTDALEFPELGAGKYPEKIEATIWGFLDQQSESDTAIYQISCKLTYWQD